MDEYYAEVGATHYPVWNKLFQLIAFRLCSKVSSTNSRSDVAGEAAVAFAASFIVFKEKDPDYSNCPLQHAKQLYALVKGI